MILDLLEKILTERQYWKIKRLFQGYPQLLEGKRVIAKTRDISKKTGVRSDHVIRDFTRIGEICNRLKVESVILDSRGNIIDDPFGDEEKRVKLGGRNNCRGVVLNWTVWDCKENK